MNERELGVRVGGRSQFLHCVVIRFFVKLGFPHQQVDLRGVSADLDQAAQSAVRELIALGLVGRNAQHVQVVQVRGLLCPERFQRVDGFHPALREEVALAQ